MLRITLTFMILSAVTALAQGGFDGAGVYHISNIDSKKVLDLDRKDKRTVIQFENRRTDNQRWEVREASGGGWILVNQMNGFALEQVSDGRSTPVEGTPLVAGKPSQRWRIERAADGNAILLSYTGLALDIPDKSRRDGVRVQVFPFNGDGNQRFYFLKVMESGEAIDKRPSLLGPGEPGGPRIPPVDPRFKPPVTPSTPTLTVPSNTESTGKYLDPKDQTWKFKGDGICLYRERQFRGEALCIPIGQDMSALGTEWAGRTMSVRLFGKVRDVDFFSEPDFRGDRIRVARDNPDLGTSPAARAASARVF